MSWLFLKKKGKILIANCIINQSFKFKISPRRTLLKTKLLQNVNNKNILKCHKMTSNNFLKMSKTASILILTMILVLILIKILITIIPQQFELDQSWGEWDQKVEMFQLFLSSICGVHRCLKIYGSYISLIPHYSGIY